MVKEQSAQYQTLEAKGNVRVEIHLLPVSVNTAANGRSEHASCHHTPLQAAVKAHAFKGKGWAGRMAQWAEGFAAGLTAGFSSWQPCKNMPVVVHSYRETDRQTDRQESHLKSTSQLILEYMVKQ